MKDFELTIALVGIDWSCLVLSGVSRWLALFGVGRHCVPGDFCHSPRLSQGFWGYLRRENLLQHAIDRYAYAFIRKRLYK